MKFYSLASLLILSVSVHAQVPATISFQGILTDESDNPITETVALTVQLYTTPTEGSPVWTHVFPTVEVIDGLYNITLGPGGTPPLGDVDFDTQLYLGVTVDTDDEMTPRTPLTAVPYALGTPPPVPKIAFLATGTSFGAEPHVSTTAVFDTEVFDYGAGYDPTTSVFAAPVAGVYHFEAEMGWSHSTSVGWVLSPAGGTYPIYAESGTSITLQMAQDDSVKIEINPITPFTGYARWLAGHLIFPTE